MCGRGGYLAKLNFMNIKKILDRRQALNKKGLLTDGEIKSLVKEWHDKRTEAELNHGTVEMEMKAMEKKLSRYNVERLGELPTEREDGTMRVLVSQMGGCASMETREIKMAATEKLPDIRHQFLRIRGTKLKLVQSELVCESRLVATG